ncbi:MAG: 2-oxoacid:acceptor oxidoreductase family protein [Kiritimatiellae bacterium]|nr:2-oxoacid:acceptor oxidoreductase family protein [Kiritimatiellia bacterium]
MLERVFIVGVGGQGVLAAGRVLAAAAMQKHPFLTFFPSYGAEVRGGVSHCQVIISSAEVASPTVERFDCLLVMSQQDPAAIVPRLAEGGTLIVNRSLCDPAPFRRGCGSVVAVDATELAARLGDDRVANMIMLGAYLRRRRVVRRTLVEKEIKASFLGKSAAVVKLNLDAFRSGLAD